MADCNHYSIFLPPILAMADCNQLIVLGLGIFNKTLPDVTLNNISLSQNDRCICGHIGSHHARKSPRIVLLNVINVSVQNLGFLN